MGHRVGSRCIGEVVIPGEQARPTAPELLRVEKGGDSEPQLAAAAQTCHDFSAGCYTAALEEELLSGLQQRVGARLGFQSDAAVATLRA